MKKIRKKKHYGRQKAAMDLCISRESLSYYENGQRNPDIDILLRLSEYFGVSADYLIRGEEFQK